MPRGKYIRTKEMYKSRSGKNHCRYKEESHIFETRICSCPNHEPFICKKSSPQIYIVGHARIGTKHTKESLVWSRHPIFTGAWKCYFEIASSRFG